MEKPAPCEQCPHDKQYKPCPLLASKLQEACKIYKDKTKQAIDKR